MAPVACWFQKIPSYWINKGLWINKTVLFTLWCWRFLQSEPHRQPLSGACRNGCRFEKLIKLQHNWHHFHYCKPRGCNCHLLQKINFSCLLFPTKRRRSAEEHHPHHHAVNVSSFLNEHRVVLGGIKILLMVFDIVDLKLVFSIAPYCLLALNCSASTWEYWQHVLWQQCQVQPKALYGSV